jgi:hypothetical protein
MHREPILSISFLTREFSIFLSGVRIMVKGESVRRSESSSRKSVTGNYDYVKAVITIAKKNGWDLDSLGLIVRDLPQERSGTLTRKQVTERNRLVKSILERFSRVLTPPVPADVEFHIRKKDARNLLPWEQEALTKIDRWREEVGKVKPEIAEELRRAVQTGPDQV